MSAYSGDEVGSLPLGCADNDIEHTFKHPEHGLSTKRAGDMLISYINDFVAKEEAIPFDYKAALKEVLLCAPSIIVIISSILLAISFGLRVGDQGFVASHLIFECAYLIALLSLECYLHLSRKYLQFRERVFRLKAAVNFFNKKGDPMFVRGLNEPVASVVHATVLRDGRWHDVPSVYLVAGDLVGVVTGDLSPARVRCVEPGFENVVMERGQVCTAELFNEGKLETSVHNPEERCCFVVEEPPILKQLESTFAPVERPLSSFIKNVRFVRKISLRVLYAIILLSIISNGIRAGLQANVDYVDVIILRQVNLVVAMSLILCPTGIAHIVKSAATAKLMAMFDMLQGSTAKGDAVGDAANFDVEDQHKHITGLPFKLIAKYFMVFLKGTHPTLVHSVNLVDILGSTTVLCCADKDGMLSEPVYSVEEITLLTGSEKSNLFQEKIITLELSPEYVKGTPTVRFNDPQWNNYLPALKPLGLNTLLNRTCRPPALAMTGRDADSAKLRFVREREQAHGVATQCICPLGKEIGFADDAFDRFDRLKELHTIAPKAEGQEAPYMVSLVVKDNSGTLQLLSKGSPDLILSSCSAYWDGEQLRVLDPEERAAVFKAYNKIVDKGGHCIAFSYPSYNTS